MQRGKHGTECVVRPLSGALVDVAAGRAVASVVDDGVERQRLVCWTVSSKRGRLVLAIAL